MLANSKLYLILDTEVASYATLLGVVRQALVGGVDIVQLRDKNGTPEDIIAFTRKAVAVLKGRIPFVVNDRVDLAIAGGADGVHLGQEDLPVSIARRLLGQKAIIGVSCQTLQQARLARESGADYIGFGSVFKTLTKPHRQPMNLSLLSRVISEISIPVFAIGGITFKNVPLLKERGVERVAVCREVCLAKDVAEAARRLKTLLTHCPCCCTISES